jgi:2-haloacid dehalogenase
MNDPCQDLRAIVRVQSMWDAAGLGAGMGGNDASGLERRMTGARDAGMTTDLPKALLFDVFGTCVDWRSGVAREGEALGRRLGIGGVDWFALADAWRDQYQPQMEAVRSGKRAWVTLDVLHRESLETVLTAFGLEDVPATERDELSLAWHRLDPWPDVVEGLSRLKSRYIIAP